MTKQKLLAIYHGIGAQAQQECLYAKQACMPLLLFLARHLHRLWVTPRAQRFVQRFLQDRKQQLVWLEAAVICVFPCLPLFCFTEILDHNDWYNHTWTIGYTGAYFRAHFAFPEILNTTKAVGFPLPVFYGFGFYPLLGVISSYFKPQVAVLVTSYAFFCLQYCAIVLLLVRMNLPRWFASAAAVIVTFAVYPLTNLYNRNALTEFYANIELTIAVAALILSLLSTNRRQTQRWYLTSVIMFALMASSHPITLRICAEFMVLFCLLLLWLGGDMRRRMVRFMAPIPLLMLPLLSPWLYAYLSVHGSIHINFNGLRFYPESFDSLSMRFSPVLFDNRFWNPPYPGINDISTPFLDAPVNMFLLGLALVLLAYSLYRYSERTKLALYGGIMLCFWAIFVWCSVSESPYGFVVPNGYQICQYAYRMVNMVNLVALAMLLGVGFLLKTCNTSFVFPLWVRMAVVMLVTASGFAFMQKMVHAYSVLRPREQQIVMKENYLENLIYMPKCFYGIHAYNSTRYFRFGQRGELPAPYREIIFSTDPHTYEVVSPISLDIGREDWYKTNVYAFSWNRIKVDGVLDVLPQVFPETSDTFNVHLTPGKHTIEYIFHPPPLWRFFRVVSLLSFVTLFALLFAVVSRSAWEGFSKLRADFL